MYVCYSLRATKFCSYVFDCKAASDGLVPGSLGMESGDIKIFQLRDNSPVSWTSYPPWYGRLNDAGCFRSTTSDRYMRVRAHLFLALLKARTFQFELNFQIVLSFLFFAVMFDAPKRTCFRVSLRAFWVYIDRWTCCYRTH